MKFSDEAWERNAALYETIRTMPFNRELAAGTLSSERFQHYIIQDAHYLLAYARVYAMAAARADTSDLLVTMADWSAGTVRAERSLHEHYFAEFGLDPLEAGSTGPTPTAWPRPPRPRCAKPCIRRFTAPCSWNGCSGTAPGVWKPGRSAELTAFSPRVQRGKGAWCCRQR